MADCRDSWRCPNTLAHQMYDDLLEALSPILPRTVYQDVRRVRTLAWAVTGLCLTHTVRLGAWAEVVESRAQYAASRVRCLARLSASSGHSSTGMVSTGVAGRSG